VIILGVTVFLLMPFTQDYVGHFLDAFTGSDRATQMRLGEYKDALILIARYPLFGVGFGSSPDIDTYIGVSSVYLLMAEEMGLLGFERVLDHDGDVFLSRCSRLVRRAGARCVSRADLARCRRGFAGRDDRRPSRSLFLQSQFRSRRRVVLVVCRAGMTAIRLGQSAPNNPTPNRL